MTKRQVLTQRAESMRKNMTREEAKLWFSFLREYPIHFANQRIMGNYILDFYCHKAKLSIELDGSQHYQKHQKDYDKARTTYLEICEIKELRFPNSAIWENFQGVCEKIHLEVQKRRNDTVSIPLSLLQNKK